MIEKIDGAPPLSVTGGLLKYWSPPIIWMSAIFFFSTDTFSGDNTGSLLWKVVEFIYPDVTQELFELLHFGVRKAGHFTIYSILALLLFRAFRSGASARWRWKWALSSSLVVFCYAALDEYHQAFTRHRTASIYDSLIDASGAVTTLFLLWLFRRKSELS
jgi:VanZ family protein